MRPGRRLRGAGHQLQASLGYSNEFKSSLSDLGSPGLKEKSERTGYGMCKPGCGPQHIKKENRKTPTSVVPISTSLVPCTRVSWGQPQSSPFWGASGVQGCQALA